jgi:hypothetical protein
MSRTLSAIIVIFLMSSLFISVLPAAHAEMVTIPLGKSIYGMMSNSKIEAHLEYLEVGDDRKGSTQTTTPLDRVKWVRLFYRFENHGDSAGTGNLKLVFIDQQGNEFKPDEGVYIGEDVGPGEMSNLEFVEIPVPKESNIVTIRVVQAFDHTDFPVPQPGSETATPTIAPTAAPSGAATSTPQASANGTGSGSCLPLLPFAILGAIGLTGLATGRMLNKK